MQYPFFFYLTRHSEPAYNQPMWGAIFYIAGMILGFAFFGNWFPLVAAVVALVWYVNHKTNLKIEELHHASLNELQGRRASDQS
jgi:hypothetical protein